MNPIKFAFVGGTSRGLKLIKKLLSENRCPEFAVILKEDDHETEKYSGEISELLDENGIPNSTKKKLVGDDYKLIRESDLDFVIVYGWRTMIDSSINKYIKSGVIVSHHSLLPRYRGFAPLQWAMINGEKEAGVTLFQINERDVDSGKIIAQVKVPIEYSDYAIDVDKKLIDVTIQLYLKFFNDYENGKVEFTEQDESNATYTCKRIPDDGRIDWNKTSLEVYNFIRALSYPFPGAFVIIDNIKYNIRKAVQGESNSKKFDGCIPGRILKISRDGIEILCREGTILISEWENTSNGRICCPSDEIKSIGITL